MEAIENSAIISQMSISEFYLVTLPKMVIKNIVRDSRLHILSRSKDFIIIIFYWRRLFLLCILYIQSKSIKFILSESFQNGNEKKIFFFYLSLKIVIQLKFLVKFWDVLSEFCISETKFTHFTTIVYAIWAETFFCVIRRQIISFLGFISRSSLPVWFEKESDVDRFLFSCLGKKFFLGSSWTFVNKMNEGCLIVLNENICGPSGKYFYHLFFHYFGATRILLGHFKK